MKITITGFDDEFYEQEKWNSLNKWIETIENKKHPIEFGFLYYPDKFGLQRYPNVQNIKNMIKSSKAWSNSLHICGNFATLDFLISYHNNPEWDFCKYFDRIQLNANWSKDHELYKLFLNTEIKTPIILQYNKVNSEVFYRYSHKDNISYLLDESRGNGVSANEITWRSNYQILHNELGYKVGFAGGVSLNNIENIVERALLYDGSSWIDLESGCRDSKGNMSLLKVTEIICKFLRCSEQ